MSMCGEVKCGLPQDGPGRPRKGWVRVSIAGIRESIWYCSNRCAAAALGHHQGRADIANCQTCAIRHDLDHTCRSCGHRPSINLFRRQGLGLDEPDDEPESLRAAAQTILRRQQRR